MANFYRNKLYFAYDLSSASRQIFPCTNPTGAVNNGTNAERVAWTGDIYGGVMAAMAPATVGNLPQRLKRAVSVWCTPVQNTGASRAGGYTAFLLPLVEAVPATTDVTATALNLSSLPPGDPRNVELTSRFGFRVRRGLTNGTVGLRGILYVQRQHSMEV